MSYDSDTVMIAGAIAGSLLIIAIFLVIYSCEKKFMCLGDEVVTTDEYTTLFNELFSGHILRMGKSCTVRDENWDERTFEWKWVDHVEAKEVI